MKHLQWRKIFSISTLVLILILGTLIVSAAPVTIDTFDDGDGAGGEGRVCDDPDGCTVTIPGVGTFPIPSSSTTTVAVLGGQRDLLVNYVSGTGTVNLRVNQGGSQRLSYASDPSTRGTGEVAWDGDADPLTINRTGLNNYDLTDGGTNNGFQLIVYSTDGSFDLTIRVINGATESTYTLNLVSAVTAPGQSFFIPFASFTGNLASFTSVGAVVFDLIQQADAVDLEMDLFEATASTDFGDLPAGYANTLLADNGARHTLGTIYLGSVIDLEADGNQTAASNGDDLQDLDDEDGVTVDMTDPWGDGSGTLNITTTGGPGCLLGWINWNGLTIADTDFADEPVGISENVINAYVATPGTAAYTITGPTSADYTAWFGGNYPPSQDARFRFFEPNDPLFGGLVLDVNGCPTAGNTTAALAALTFGQATGGEVEDYQFLFNSTPTAVTLQGITTAANTTIVLWGIVALFIASLAGVSTIAYRKRQS